MVWSGWWQRAPGRGHDHAGWGHTSGRGGFDLDKLGRTLIFADEMVVEIGARTILLYLHALLCDWLNLYLHVWMLVSWSGIDIGVRDDGRTE